MPEKVYPTKSETRYVVRVDDRDKKERCFRIGKDGLEVELQNWAIAVETAIVDFKYMKDKPAELIRTLKGLVNSDNLNGSQHYRFVYIDSKGRLAHSERIIIKG